MAIKSMHSDAGRNAAFEQNPSKGKQDQGGRSWEQGQGGKTDQGNQGNQGGKTGGQTNR